MKPEAQRIAIAEWCGYERWVSSDGTHSLLTKPNETQRAYWIQCGDKINSTADIKAISDRVPDYLNDLNVLREAWLKLSPGQQDVFAGYLAEVFNGRRDFGAMRIDCSTKILGASAAQWAEALLRTIGKWVEE